MSAIRGSSFQIGPIVSRLQTRFIHGASVAEVFDPMLGDLLEATGSEYGFVAELCTDTRYEKFLRILVLTDISWDDVTRLIYRRHCSGEKPVEFHNLKTLFGAAVLTGEIVISNDPSSDPRSGGLPPGHPKMNSFLGVPLFHGGGMVGLIGLSNRPGGYDPALVETLTPLFSCVASIIDAVRTDHALRRSEHQLQTIVEMAPVGISEIALDGRFLRVNKKLCSILGRSREDLLTMRCHDITLPEDLAADGANMARLLSKELTSYTVEKRLLHASGQAVWASVSVSAVGPPLGAPTHLIEVVEDVTERRKSEATRLAAEAAHRANLEKNCFLSQMSHELRTPLNAVIGFSQLLQIDPQELLSPAQTSKVHHIREAGSHLLHMIDDILDLSRIESGDLSISPEAVALQQIVHESMGMVQNMARFAEVTITVLAVENEAPVFVYTDRLRLRQVVVNLMSNAIKYNRPGGEVTVAWSRRSSGKAVELRILDNGTGMSRDQLKHLYEPFNRLGAERSGVQGTGIGLVLTRKLVQLMDGEIAVESEVGRGSCFTVSLATGEAPGTDSAESLPAEWPDDQRRNILYAEDNATNVMLMTSVLHSRPLWRLSVARNGTEAQLMARQDPPDLILLDMHLGDMSGIDVAQALARDAVTAGIPLVALSADAMPSSVEAAMALGFSAYITKPLDVRALLKALDRLLRQVG